MESSGLKLRGFIRWWENSQRIILSLCKNKLNIVSCLQMSTNMNDALAIEYKYDFGDLKFENLDIDLIVQSELDIFIIGLNSGRNGLKQCQPRCWIRCFPRKTDITPHEFTYFYY